MEKPYLESVEDETFVCLQCGEEFLKSGEQLVCPKCGSNETEWTKKITVDEEDEILVHQSQG